MLSFVQLRRSHSRCAHCGQGNVLVLRYCGSLISKTFYSFQKTTTNFEPRDPAGTCDGTPPCNTLAYHVFNYLISTIAQDDSGHYSF